MAGNSTIAVHHSEAESAVSHAHTAAPTGHGESAGHGAGGHGSHPPEVPSGLDLLATLPFAQRQVHLFDVTVESAKTGQTVQVPIRFTVGEAIRCYQNQFFVLLLVAFVSALVVRKLRKASLQAPGRFQALVEMFVEAFRDLVFGVLGEKNGRKYLPYLGSLFLFILLGNLMGLIPLLRSPTSVYQTTFALGLCTFFYVQFTAVRRNGLLRYLYHMMGEPRGDGLGMKLFMWGLGLVLLLPLHILGELIKPISLSLRLFGNILGEDILLGVFVTMGLGLMGLFGWSQPWVGLPLQLPFFFLALLTSSVQAMVFALLSMVYFLMVLPHDEEAHH
ncbi:MAG: F0F1 ATP synthase subunit A [Candidatus Sumerlaeia bacterium]|nr:F0F1 ATP synthase subunit A [Candidatus Sumerlaeia bacterium]